MKICDTCGNEIPNTLSICPYCKSTQSKTELPPKYIVTVNLEDGMPLAQDALKKLDAEIRYNSRMGVKAIRLIHGWGSSGTGGKIRELVIKRLRAKKQKGTIKHYYCCESCINNIDKFQELISIYPELSQYFERDKNNKGVTYIIL